nr:rod shape-determining protein [Veillonella denticariosi]
MAAPRISASCRWGGIVSSKTIRFGGSDINTALLRYIRQCFGVMVSDETIMDLKHSIGTLLRRWRIRNMSFRAVT